MQIDLTHPDFQAAIPILQTIEQAGYEAYFVGGSVRDALLGLPIHDVDIASSAYPEEIKQIFHKTVDTGIQHGTVMVLQHGIGYEVTTFRTESTYQDFRRPDHVTFVRSLAEDLKRRDFTVNALAARHDGTVVDLFGGINDLQAQVLKAVGDAHARFHEDALRMMRAVRFESQLDFCIEADTRQAIEANAALLEKISVERIATEFVKMMRGQARAAGLTDFVATGLSEHAPLFAGHQAQLQALVATDPAPITSDAVVWTLISAGLALPPVKVMKAWKQANALSSTVQRAVALLPQIAAKAPWPLFEAGADGVEAAAYTQAYLQPGFDAQAILKAYAQLPIKSSQALAVNGGLLIKNGLKPGPKLGQILHQLVVAVVTGKLANDQDTLLKVALAQ